jgi:hypothetical protein
MADRLDVQVGNRLPVAPEELLHLAGAVKHHATRIHELNISCEDLGKCRIVLCLERLPCPLHEILRHAHPILPP